MATTSDASDKTRTVITSLDEFAEAFGLHDPRLYKSTRVVQRDGRACWRYDPRPRPLVPARSLPAPRTMRTRHGRAGRVATNSRARGSRRSSARSPGGSRGDPDGESSEPPGGRLHNPAVVGAHAGVRP